MPVEPKPSDPPLWRFLFMLATDRPWFVTVWLALPLAAIVLITITAGPIIAATLTGAALTGTALVKRRRRPASRNARR
jgi:hypothetical protein